MGMRNLVYGLVVLLIADKVNCGVVPIPTSDTDEKHLAETPEKIHYVGKTGESPDTLSWKALSSEQGSSQTSGNPSNDLTSKYPSLTMSSAKSRKQNASNLPLSTQPKINPRETVSARQTKTRNSTVQPVPSVQTITANVSTTETPPPVYSAETISARSRTTKSTIRHSTSVQTMTEKVSTVTTPSPKTSIEPVTARKRTTMLSTTSTAKASTVSTTMTRPPVPSVETMTARRRTTRLTVQPWTSLQTRTATTAMTPFTTPAIPSPATATSRPSHHGSHQLKHIIFILLAILVVVSGILIILAFGKGYFSRMRFTNRFTKDKTPVYHELKNLHM